jgi:hypothetical protein
MTIREAIQVSIPVFEASQRAGASDLCSALVAAGIPSVLAPDLVDFLPLALARAMLEGSGVGFADHYVRKTSQGRVIGTKPLLDEPVYREGLAIACELSGHGEGGAFLAVAGRSPEYQAVSRAIDNGLKAADLECHPPVVSAGYEDQRRFHDTSGGRQPRVNPWWQFWRG